MVKKERIELSTPGEILKEEFLDPLGITEADAARDLEISVSRLSEIIHGKQSISSDIAMRLSLYFKTTPQFWINFQANYDLQKIQEENPTWLRTIKPLRRRKPVQSSLKSKKAIA